MVMLRDALIFLAGLVLASTTLSQAVQTVVVPRNQGMFLTRLTFRVMYLFYRVRLNLVNTYEARDAIMASYSPLSLIALPVVWILLIMLGYTAMFWAVGERPLESAFLLSGSSLLTLGFAPVSNLAETILAFTEATIGLGIVALLISYLPTIYAAYSKREETVTMLEVRAGSPPSAIEMISRAYRISAMDRMAPLWQTWEVWFSDVEESHASFPSLIFFRSPTPDRAWVTAAGVVLDSAALLQSVVDAPPDPQRSLCIRASFICLRRLADFFNVPHNPNPQPTDPISITRAEFDDACERLAAEGVPLKADRDQAWRDFKGWRVNYDTVLLAMAEIYMAPPAEWVSDRGSFKWKLDMKGMMDGFFHDQT